jgi:hypothetical protein
MQPILIAEQIRIAQSENLINDLINLGEISTRWQKKSIIQTGEKKIIKYANSSTATAPPPESPARPEPLESDI